MEVGGRYIPVVLDARQRQAFDRDGFLNLGPIFAPDELERIREEYDRLVTLEAQVLGNEEEGVFPYRAMLNFRSADLKRMITPARLLAVATELLGPDVRFWWDQGINKSPGAGSYIAWHQDNGYTKGRISEYLTCWLALDPSDFENGGLQVIPGSHRGGQREHEMQGAHAVIPNGTIDVGNAVALDADAGDLLIFSSLLVHQTVGNQTDHRQRRAWVVQYCAGDQRNQVTGEVYDNRPWVVRNGVALEAPVVERRFELGRDRA